MLEYFLAKADRPFADGRGSSAHSDPLVTGLTISATGIGIFRVLLELSELLYTV